MANTITNISLANTFGDWVSTTVQTVTELNSIGKFDWRKDAGTLYLDSTGTALDVANTVYFRGGVNITGIGSGLTVAKNADIRGTLTASNQDTDANPNKLVFSANGVANINYLNVTGTGLASNVSNNMSIGGTLTVTGNTSLSANLIVTRDITGNNGTITYDWNVNRNLSAANVVVTNNTYITGDGYIGGKSTVGRLVSNTNVTTVTLNTSGTAWTNKLISNTAVEVPGLYASTEANVQYMASNTDVVASRTVRAEYVQANTAANTTTLSVTGTSSTDYLQANTAANTRTLSVTGTASADRVVANTVVQTPSANGTTATFVNIQANSSVNTAYANAYSVSVSSDVSTNYLQANTAANTTTLSVTGTASVNQLTANSLVDTPLVQTTSANGTSSTFVNVQANAAVNTTTMSVTGTTLTNQLTANSLVQTPSANGTTLTFVNVQANAAVNTTTLSATGTAIVNQLTANSLVQTPSANGTTATFVNIQANSAVNTTTMSVTGTVVGNQLTANSLVQTPLIQTTSANGTTLTFVDVQANAAVNTTTFSATGTASVNRLTANSLVQTPSANGTTLTFVDVQANSAVNTTTVSVTGTASVNRLTANSLVQTPSANGTTLTFVNVQANAAVNTTTLSVTGTATGNQLVSNTNIVANSGTVWASLISAPSIRFTSSILGGTGSSVTADSGVFGNLSVSGNFTITGATIYNSDTITLNASQSSNVNAFFTNYRPGGANAQIRWNETSKWWDVRDVESPSTYYRLLTTTDFASPTFTGAPLAPTAATGTSNTMIATTAFVQTANTNMKGYVDTMYAPLASPSLTGTPSSPTAANGTYSTQIATTAFVNNANNILRTFVGATYAPLASPSLTGTPLSTTAANGTYTTQIATTAFVNNANNIQRTYSEATYVKLSPGTSQTISNDLTITGNLIIRGTQLISNTSIIETDDSLVKLAANNITDAIDLGFYGRFGEGTVGSSKYTGLVRKAGSNTYYLLKSMTADPTTNTISWAGITTGNNANLVANLTGGIVSGLSAAIGIGDGGTNNTTFSNGQIVHFDGSKLASLANTGTAGTYGAVSRTLTITTDALGRVSGVTNNAISITASQIADPTGTGYAVLNTSPILSGTPLSTTAANGTYTTQIATTEFVNNANNILKTYVDTLYAPLASPTLTDAPLAPTAAAGTSNTMIATTAFVQTANSNMKTYTDGTFVKLTSGTTQTITGTVSLSTALGISSGGTNNNTFTAGRLVHFDGTKLASLANTGTTGTYGSTGNIPVITVDTLGRITSIANVAVAIPPAGVVTISANSNQLIANGVSGTSLSGNLVLGLATSGVSSGTYGGGGSTLTIPVITIDSFGRATVAANTTTLTLPTSQGGTGQTTAATAITSFLDAVTGTKTSGYVLTTGGAGNYYWAASSGGGGGATPGTTIQSSRLTYTANGAAGYTGNSFTTPEFSQSTQLRAYINGVRQFDSVYTANSSANSISFLSTPYSGDVVMLEVDGFISNPYFANNITFTAPFGSIAASANTIQLAIQDIETRKATLASPTFTGAPVGPTAATGTSNTMLSTTAFVQTANSNMKTYVDGRFAPLASPTLTGAPIAPTAATGTSNTMIATTAFVQTANSNMKTYVDNTLTTYAANTSTANVRFMSLGVGTAANGVNGEIIATGQITAYYSDERLKNNLGNIDNALEKVNQINGFYHEASDLAVSLGYNKIREVGVSAQEVEKVLPEVVVPAPVDNNYLTVRYERLVPLLIEAIKELNQKVEDLQRIIDSK